MNKIIILILSLSLFSCMKDELVSSTTKDIPVIQSFLLAGKDSIVVKVQTLKPYTNDTTDTEKAISGLNIYINKNLLTEQAAGTYLYTASDLHIEPNDTFNLSLSYNNATVTSQTIIPTKPLNFAISTDTIKVKQMTSTSFSPESKSEMVTLELTWDNTAKDYHFIVLEWVGTSKVYTNTIIAAEDILTKKTSSPNQDNTYNINQMELGLYGKYRAVLCRINKEYYDLLQTTNLNSNNMTNPPSNVSNGWGLFTAMSSDTVYFWVLKK